MERGDLVKILALASLALGLGVPLASGTLKPLVVLSSSMEPLMSPGDLMFIVEEPPEEIQRGDIMAFEDPSGRTDVLITHRVVGISREGGGLKFKTKGDALEEPDPFEVQGPDVVGRAIFQIPLLGYLFHYGNRPLTFLLLIAVPASLIVLEEARNIAKYSDPIQVRKAERDDVKEKRGIERWRADYKVVRAGCIFLIALAIFGSISIPSLKGSGHNREVEGIEGGFFPTIVVHRSKENAIPRYSVVFGGRLNLGAGQISMISMAPYIMPPLLVGTLAEVDPTLPSLVTFILPPTILTMALYPAWRRLLRRGSPNRGRG